MKSSQFMSRARRREFAISSAFLRMAACAFWEHPVDATLAKATTQCPQTSWGRTLSARTACSWKPTA